MIKKFYAGIGSRETPRDVLKSMRTIAKILFGKGYILRSGGAEGADTEFAVGAAEASFGSPVIPYRIYLPSSAFGNLQHNPSRGFYDSRGAKTWEQAMELVDKYHPAPEKLSDFGRRLMARNAYQVLSTTLKDPVDFVICWTKSGKLVGGTAQALKIAMDWNIPIYNLALSGDVMRLNLEVLNNVK
jgi:hypothetical protein